jgi:tyrosyl-tRNA synthetase
MEQDDESIASLLHRFTLDSVADTAALMARHAENPAARRAQRHLARTVTSMVHGVDVEARAATVADALFGDGEGGTPDLRALTAEALVMLAGELPTSGLPAAADSTLVDLVIAAGLATSKSEARRLIEQGGVSVNGAPAPDGAAAASSFTPLADGSLLLRKGRRDYRLLRRA